MTIPAWHFHLHGIFVSSLGLGTEYRGQKIIIITIILRCEVRRYRSAVSTTGSLDKTEQIGF